MKTKDQLIKKLLETPESKREPIRQEILQRFVFKK